MGAPQDIEPLAPGVTLARRTLLWLPVAAGVGGALFGAPLHGEQAPSADEARASGALTPLDWGEFGRRWQALAKELELLPAAHDESYAGALAALVARVPVDALPVLEAGNRKGGLRAGPSWFLAPVVTVEFALDADAEVRLHNHPPQVVLTLCAEGEVAYRHFEVEGSAPACDSGSPQAFVVRETRAGLLRSGRTTTLTRARDGIHGFRARAGAARLIDFTLGLSASEVFSYVELGAERDPGQRLFEARWLGRG